MKLTYRGIVSIPGLSLLLTGALACTGQAADRRPAAGAPPGDTMGAGSTALPARTGPRLTAVLGRIERNADTEIFLEYGDQAIIRALAGGDVRWRARFRGLELIGAPNLAGVGPRLAQPTGVDVARATVAYSAGRIPKDAGLLVGDFDPAVIDRRLAGLRYERDPDDQRIWLIKDFGGLGSRHPLARLGVTSWFDTVRVTKDEIAYARTTEVLSQVTEAAARPRLDESRAHRDVAECLGDPIAARILTPAPAARQPGGRGAPVALAGAGVRATAPGEVREVLCYKAGKNGAAIARRLGEMIGKDDSRRHGRPWRALLTDAATETLPAGVVRLTARPAAGVPAGVLLGAITEYDLPGVIGKP